MASEVFFIKRNLVDIANAELAEMDLMNHPPITQLFIDFFVVIIILILFDYICNKGIQPTSRLNTNHGPLAEMVKKGEITTMNEFENTIVVDFPLRGEWIAPNTPGKKVPSHGTDQLGQRYAYDFLQVDWRKKGMHFYNSGKLRYFLFGVPLKKCYCWGKEIHAPCDGKIVDSKDGLKERPRVHLLSDMFVVLKNALTFNPENNDIQCVVGNYVVMECANNVFAFFAHLRKDSITVSMGEKVNKGQVLGEVGHSGNSTAPHLHFHLMDSRNLLEAKGIPCVFENYEILRGDKWLPIKNGMPTDTDKIRFNG